MPRYLVIVVKNLVISNAQMWIAPSPTPRLLYIHTSSPPQSTPSIHTHTPSPRAHTLHAFHITHIFSPCTHTPPLPYNTPSLSLYAHTHLLTLAELCAVYWHRQMCVYGRSGVCMFWIRPATWLHSMHDMVVPISWSTQRQLSGFGRRWHSLQSNPLY